ncbi:MAG TPA: HAMP domain-containing sensor histidine kinase, partial [Opitutaceae bacterium]|nr:HAMP domain-containing sensor histidine kinase [Opitutaceae bacterium]
NQNALGLLITVPQGSRTPSLALAVGFKTNQWPFTYQEVQRLRNIAELMDNILTRSRLTTQAALTARVEYLAMMSRGLAHDLKNLITPISSYLVHTENTFPSESAEAEVYSAARRSVRVMTDYVREALFFSQRLSPDFGPINFPKLFDDVHATTVKRAADRSIILAFDTTQTTALNLVADAVLLQRLLANLVVNAIDASRSGQTVKVSAVASRNGWVKLLVADHGSGISSDNLARIFDPYFTTKEFGDEVRGFGLGLTICQKIAHLHGGSISVMSQPQSGTAVTVELPVKPPPSVSSSATSTNAA